VIVGGLFAIIALNFTINSAYKSIASGDNTVLLYCYDLHKRLGGQHIQEQVFNYPSWVVSLLAAGTAFAFIFVAASLVNLRWCRMPSAKRLQRLRVWRS
jgi:hypothetical protein